MGVTSCLNPGSRVHIGPLAVSVVCCVMRGYALPQVAELLMLTGKERPPPLPPSPRSWAASVGVARPPSPRSPSGAADSEQPPPRSPEVDGSREQGGALPPAEWRYQLVTGSNEQAVRSILF